jgi:RNA-directed DNA polymerase
VVARLQRGCIWVFVTTGVSSEFAQSEIVEDRYLIILINGLVLAEQVRHMANEDHAGDLMEWSASRSWWDHPAEVITASGRNPALLNRLIYSAAHEPLLARRPATRPLEAPHAPRIQVLRGWTAYFRPGVSARAFQYLRMIVWPQVFGWLGRKYPDAGWKELRRRFCDGRWWPHDGQVVLFNPGSVVTTRYLPRGTKIPSPWPSTR